MEKGRPEYSGSALFFIFDAVNANWLYKSFKYLKKVFYRNERRVVAYLVCIIIATGFWFLNALSKIYTVDILAPVSYVNFPKSKTLAKNLPENFELTIKAHGFTILRRKVIFLFMPLEFNVNDLTGNRMLDNHRNSFTFPVKQFLPKLSYQLSNDIEILSMNPDTLFFRFDKHGQKRIKAKPVVQVNLKKQYQISGKITNTPDSVLVNGPQSVLDTLQFVFTEKQQFNMADKSILAAMKINPVKELYFDPQMVDVNIPIEEFTEAQQLVSVVLAGKPANLKIKLFPARVKVTFQVGLSHFAEIHPEDFKLTVLYSDILKGKPRLKITAESTPEYLYDLKITPEELEYLIEN